MKLRLPSSPRPPQPTGRAGDFQSPSGPSSSATGRRLEVAGTQTRQSGVALVATLIMLSLVTFMVVAFLGIARRERRSVEASLTQSDARVANEYALNRAQGDLASRLFASGDKWNYGLMVPTNFQNNIFNTTADPTNVNHVIAISQGLNAWLTNLANLYYDARVPVFSTNFTNVTLFAPLLSEANQGRYYLDFNQNGIFEPTDRFQSGDPHWLGILANAGQRHGPNNPFVARYTYLIAPVGRTLDANLIHNQAKRGPPLPGGATGERFYRNLGLGPHEMNLAALLAQLNPYWGYNYQLAANAQSTFVPNTRDAHRDALRLLLFRNNGSANNYPTLQTLFGAGPATTLVNERFDVLGNGPLMNSTNLASPAADLATIPWPGGTNTTVTPQQLNDLNELFLTTRSYSTFLTTNLQYLGQTNEATFTTIGDRNRRTYYDLLSVLGVESAPLTNKLNLNWSNAPFYGTNILLGAPGGDVSGFTGWHPDYFFFNTAELMLRASCSPSIFINNNWTGFAGTDPLVLSTNFTMGGGFTFNYVNTYYTNSTLQFPFLYAPGVGFMSNVYAGFIVEPNRTNNGGISLSLTNIPLYPFSYYSGEVHRLLQFAANLYDATTTNNASPAYPTLFRPLFAFNTNGWPSNDFVRISGYTTNQTDTALLGLPVYDLNDPDSRMAMYTNGTVAATGDGFHQLCLLSGTPVIIGAKKGYPNFNEYAMQTVFSLTRRLEYAKTNATNSGPLALVNPRPLNTNQSLILSLYNINAFEVWNSYVAPFPRALQLVATNTTRIVITNEFGPVYSTNFTNTASVNYPAGTWLGMAAGTPSFKGFLFTNCPHLALTNYTGGPNPYFPTTNVFLPAGFGGPGLPGYTYQPPLAGATNGGSFNVAGQLTFNRGDSNRFPELKLGITMTNSIVYALVDANRIVDYVNIGNLVSGMDLAAALSSTNGNPAEDNADRLRRFFDSNRVGGGTNPVNPTIGISNQFAQSTNFNLSQISANLAEWTGWRGSVGLPPVPLLQREIERFRRFMGLPPDPNFPPNQIQPTGLSIQAPYTATRIVALSTSWEVNDPLVHYMRRDMENLFRTTEASRLWRKPLIPLMALPPPPGSIYAPGYRADGNNYPAGFFLTPPALGLNKAYAPWGRAPYAGDLPQTLTNYYTVAPAAYDQRLKDAGIYNSDQWDFPQRKFANLGWIGRVHRGTPWQTFNLKSDQPNPTNWYYWAHSYDTSPTNDWRLVDIFTTAINSDATRSLLSVNQTNRAAWAAALGGTLVLSNNGAFIVSPPASTIPVITPQTPQLASIVGDFTTGLINAKHRVPMWNAAASYSPGDVVSYSIGPYGGTSNYVAVAGTNQSQNPYLQNSAGNYGFWTNVPFWNNAAIYTFNDLVVYAGVPYYSLSSGNAGNGPHTNRTFWEPFKSRSFNLVGKVLTTHELSTLSPYLNIGQAWNGGAYAQGARVYWQGWYYQALRAAPAGNPPNPYLNYSNPRTMAQSYWWPLESPPIARNVGTIDCLTDVFVERIPQQTLGLLTLESSPRVAIYAYGQSLKPAERGIYVGGAGGGAFSGMVTNYQITGEFASRTLIRIEGLPEPGLIPSPLPAGAPPLFQPRVVVESHKLLPPR